MKCRLGFVLFLVCAACSAGDDTATGSHANCAEGGAINNDCSGALSTARDACWKLVDCAAISINSGDIDKHFDWGACVDRLETAIDVEQTLIINCIAASTCDALKVQGSPQDPNPNAMACLRLGGQR